MIAVYLRYNGVIQIHQGGATFAEDKVVRAVPAGVEQHLVDCVDEYHAAQVVSSWLLDPDTITIRTVRQAA